MTHDEVLRVVWRMHDAERRPMSEIARELRTSEAAVHSCITEIWGMTRGELAAAGILVRRGWED